MRRAYLARILRRAVHHDGSYLPSVPIAYYQQAHDSEHPFSSTTVSFQRQRKEAGSDQGPATKQALSTARRDQLLAADTLSQRDQQWTEVVDKVSGHVYYWNEATGYH